MPGPRPQTRRLVVAFAAALLAAGTLGRLSAHEIPADVTIKVFVKPEGQFAHVLVRVPLGSLLDIDWPMRGIEELDLDRIEPYLRDGATLWVADNIEFYENGAALPYPALLGARASLPSDPSFATYDEALGHITGPALTNDTVMYRNQGFLDARFDYPIQSETSSFSIHPKFARLGVRTLTELRYVQRDGSIRAFEYQGDAGLVRLDPTRLQTIARFGRQGIGQVLDATDALLFLLCLAMPFRRMRPLVPVVGAFVVAHSITLVASAYGMAPNVNWFPPLVDTLIAASIVYLVLENLVVERPVHRWIPAFGFGLAHGFGFALALQQTTQFAGAHHLAAVLAYNAGIEIGALAVLVAAVPALDLLFGHLVAPRIGTIVLSALVGHTAWHWMADRWAVLRQFPVTMPVVDAAFLALTLRWLMVFVALAGAVWLAQLLKKPAASKGEAATES